MNLTHSLSTALLASCLAVSASFEVKDDSSGPIPSAIADIEISSTDADEPPSMLDVLSAVANSSGVQIHAGSEVMSRMKARSTGFHEDFTIPAGEAWTVVEHMLLQGGFVLSALHMGETKLVAVHEIGSDNRFIAKEYLSVTVDELDYLSVHPGFYFTLSMTLENFDTRTLLNQMRGLDLHQTRIQSVNIGSNQLLLRGIGIEVEFVARQLLELNEEAGKRLAEEPEEGEAEQAANSEGATAD